MFRFNYSGKESPYNRTLSRESKKEWMQLCKQLAEEHPMAGQQVQISSGAFRS